MESSLLSKFKQFNHFEAIAALLLIVLKWKLILIVVLLHFEISEIINHVNHTQANFPHTNVTTQSRKITTSVFRHEPVLNSSCGVAHWGVPEGLSAIV